MQEPGAAFDPDRLAVAFGLTVRRHRKARGLTQEKLAEFAHVHAVYVSMIERGVNQPSLATFYTFAAALEVGADAFAREVEESLREVVDLPTRRESVRRKQRGREES